MSASPNPVEAPAHILSLLNRLHAESSAQEAALGNYLSKSAGFDDLMRDKFIALDQDKCHFVYLICRAIRARNVIEVGTSFGVSTMYLALAVGSNAKLLGQAGMVIATEKESSKAQKARQYWHEAGERVESQIELREGDLQETLASDLPTVDLLLLDIWAPLALPALKLVEHKLRSGAVIIVDNSISSAAQYADLLTYLRTPEHGFTSVTIPYSNGLEMVMKT
ncbi:MAG: hypothetical protein Q9191_006960 [Dirinaria sp. TL-2023a]